ncbi:MAG TPA: hypothetical protein VG797_05040 [Phycisphaerales bacterium]|nr:hypothetical protein [Phycisphaerales bacterium]
MANKFKMKFKVTGLELEIEGDRADIPLMTQNIGSQFVGLLEPAANIAEGEAPAVKKVANDAKPAAQIEDKSTKGRGRRKIVNGGGGGSKSTITLTPDHERWGAPSQDWTGTEKSIWLLKVLADGDHKGGATANEIANVFAEHFQTAGKLTRQNVDSGLRGVANGADALVVRQGTGKFTLTQKGIAKATTLVEEVKPKASV